MLRVEMPVEGPTANLDQSSPSQVNVSLLAGDGDSLSSICTMSLGKGDLGHDQESALTEFSTLWQNFPSNNGAPDCREAFQKATAIGFMSRTTNVSVCMDSLQLLPSTVLPAGMQGYAMP